MNYLLARLCKLVKAPEQQDLKADKLHVVEFTAKHFVYLWVIRICIQTVFVDMSAVMMTMFDEKRRVSIRMQKQAKI